MGPSTSVAYIWAIVISLVFLLIAAIVANLISNKPGGADIKRRRTWYWVLFVIAIAATLAINIYTAYTIKVPTKHSAYMTAAGISTAVGAVVYILLGLGLSKGMSRSKLGSWF